MLSPGTLMAPLTGRQVAIASTDEDDADRYEGWTLWRQLRASVSLRPRQWSQLLRWVMAGERVENLLF